MDKRKWQIAGLEITKYLNEIRKIAKRNNVGHLSVAVFLDGTSWVTYIDGENHFDVEVGQDGTITLLENQKEYFKSIKEEQADGGCKKSANGS